MDPARIEDAAARVIRGGGSGPLTALADRDGLQAALRIVAEYDPELLVRIATEAVTAGGTRPPGTRRRGPAC